MIINITLQYLMAVPLVLTLDGTSPGQIQNKMQLTHSIVQEEQKSKVIVICKQLNYTT